MASEKMMLTGNYATAYGVKLARAEVIPVYPITPQTTIIEKIIEFISEKKLEAEYISVESEHSVMAAAIGATAAGARAFTASSSQGIAYMHENLFVASALRLPLVMAIVNRTMNPPIGIGSDHSDSLAQRDTGWLQVYVENAQEALDMVIQAYRIAEDKRVLLPVAICYEGMVISHFLEPVEVPDQGLVDKFLPGYNPEHVILDPERPMHICISSDEYHMEYRYQQEQAMERSKTVIEEVDQEFKNTFGRCYGGLIDTYMMEDAEIALISMGSIYSLSRMAVKELRKEGIKAGAIKLRAFRPFPREALEDVAKNLKLMIVLDRAVSLGYGGGIVYSELASTLCNSAHKPQIIDYIIGLAGRQLGLSELLSLLKNSIANYREGRIEQPVRWVGVRGLS